jgi:hypothetical protein
MTFLDSPIFLNRLNVEVVTLDARQEAAFVNICSLDLTLERDF